MAKGESRNISLLNVIFWFVRCDSSCDVYCLECGVDDRNKKRQNIKKHSLEHKLETRNALCRTGFHLQSKHRLWQAPALGWCQWVFRLCKPEICHEPVFLHVFLVCNVFFGVVVDGCSFGLMTIGLGRMLCKTVLVFE